ncbi:hypothetical protein Slin15195_G118310 [Septoria linicola]|uniref:Uncharacterized protein n=1 Tax=Septoria linicola TaxID=215465 RepID=A0A9Q9B716_9PEZI|nr:hypothetical protein Slin15195_G118310 [Septoria linicola]
MSSTSNPKHHVTLRRKLGIVAMSQGRHLDKQDEGEMAVRMVLLVSRDLHLLRLRTDWPQKAHEADVVPYTGLAEHVLPLIASNGMMPEGHGGEDLNMPTMRGSK